MVIKIVVVDDHQMFREAIVEHLNEQGDIQVVAQTGNGADVIGLLMQHRPDVLLLDLNLNGLDGDEALRIMRQLELDTPVIVLSMHTDISYVGRVLALGIKGYLIKDETLDQLVEAIRIVKNGGEFFSPRVTTATPPKPGQQKHENDSLTTREIEVLSLIASGLTSSEIATKLGRSLKTVESHRSNILKKLGLTNVAGLTRYAIRKGYISP